MSAKTGTHAYYSVSGEIVIIHSGTAESAASQDNSYAGAIGYIEVKPNVTPFTHYIANGQAVEKSSITPSVSIDGDTATITGIPAGLEASFDGVIAITDNETLELTVDEPDTYTLRIDGGAKYFDTEVEIDFG
jgi:hypothetical protein